MTNDLSEYLLPGLPVDKIRECYSRADGNEIGSRKFFSERSSAALAANAFGYFLERASSLPPLPGTEALGWPASKVDLEAVVRFPWSGGRHPCLDVLIDTSAALIGVESKRYEPFDAKGSVEFSEAYSRDVWGSEMTRYQQLRDDLKAGVVAFTHLDAVQLVKHAFALRTAVHKDGERFGRLPVLFYVFAEPATRPNGTEIAAAERAAHRAEIERFADAVRGDDVQFQACSYAELLQGWSRLEDSGARTHAAALAARFRV